MTAPTTTPAPSAAPASAKPGPGTGGVEGLDIRRVISGSTADVPVAELSRKGLKNVKVLNQGTITRLITEAVDKVISDRSKAIGREERQKVIHESQSQFEALAKDRVKHEKDRISELERANDSLLRETEDLRRRLAEKDAEIGKLKSSPPSEGFVPERFAEALIARIGSMKSTSGGGDVSELQKSIQSIAAKLDRLPAGKGPDGAPVDEEAMIDALFRVDTEDKDTNVAQIKVKEAKAGGVKDTLAKLKSLQKGGD
jgi:hypothetical protein